MESVGSRHVKTAETIQHQQESTTADTVIFIQLLLHVVLLLKTKYWAFLLPCRCKLLLRYSPNPCLANQTSLVESLA
jgi:hypothetical protein